MRQATTIRTVRLQVRITEEALAVVRRAAEIQGRSISEFVVAAAQEAAQKAISDVEIIRLSREAQEKVASLLANPLPPSRALRRAFARHRTTVSQ